MNYTRGGAPLFISAAIAGPNGMWPCPQGARRLIWALRVPLCPGIGLSIAFVSDG